MILNFGYVTEDPWLRLWRLVFPALTLWRVEALSFSAGAPALPLQLTYSPRVDTEARKAGECRFFIGRSGNVPGMND